MGRLFEEAANTTAFTIHVYSYMNLCLVLISLHRDARQNIMVMGTRLHCNVDLHVHVAITIWGAYALLSTLVCEVFPFLA